MDFRLMHKNIPVLDFQTTNGAITKVTNIITEKHVPIGILPLYNTNSIAFNFANWWTLRAIPISRQNIRNALEILKISNVHELVFKSNGLSLSDHYWIKTPNSNLKWEEVNFFKNPFSKDTGKALFGTLNITDDKDIDYLSPNATLDGWLQKRWDIENNQRILIKGGSSIQQQEVFNELIASKIYALLDIPHVEYKLKEENGKYYSICKDFVDENTELVSAASIRDSFVYDRSLSNFNNFIKACESNGIKNMESIKEKLCKMFVVDYIMANTDRHFTNFGFLRNPDTLEWIDLAPIFDTGTSLFFDTPLATLKNKIDDRDIIAKPFATRQSEQIKKLPIKDYCLNMDISKLKEIPSIFNKLLQINPEFSEERRRAVCFQLSSRIDSIDNYLKKLRNNEK